MTDSPAARLGQKDAGVAAFERYRDAVELGLAL
jgi:hypothetical protein